MKKCSAIFLYFLLLFLIRNIYADENTIFLKQIDEYNKLMEGYQSIMEGYEYAMSGNIADQLTAMTGLTDTGNFLNGTSEQDARAWSASEWASVVSGGNASRYKQLLEDYQAAHPTLSATQASEGMSSENVTDYQQQVETNQAASSQATYAFNNTNSHLETINQLAEKINGEKDTKHIEDLNARINAEIAYLQVEVIKGIAVLNQQIAQQQATEIHDKTEAAKFNQIPD